MVIMWGLNMLISLIVVIISQSIHMSNITLYILNACNFIYLNYTSIKLKKYTKNLQNMSLWNTLCIQSELIFQGKKGKIKIF